MSTPQHLGSATKARRHEVFLGQCSSCLRVFVAVTLSVGIASGQPTPQRFDLILRHGTVLDGSSNRSLLDAADE